jgi:hypothetical protein
MTATASCRWRLVAGCGLIIAACTGRGQAKLHRLIIEGHDYLEVRRAENEAKYHLSAYAHYDWHQDTGEIVFSSGGEAKVIASIQMVGDVSKRSGTWLWAWANKTVDEPLKKAANAVRDMGEREKIDRLTTAQWPADETDGWEMTSVAANLTQAAGAYRTCGDSGCEYLLLTKIDWVSPRVPTRHVGDLQTPPTPRTQGKSMTAEHAVVVHFTYGLKDLQPLREVEGRLEHAIKEAGVGDYDGDEIATNLSDGFLYMYGPDADRLFAAARPVLETASFMRGAVARVRYGPPGSREMTVLIGGH